MYLILWDQQSAVLLQRPKLLVGAHSSLCVRAWERLGSLSAASASPSGTWLGSGLECVHIAQSHSWDLLCLQLSCFLQVGCSLITLSLQSRSKADQ